MRVSEIADMVQNWQVTNFDENLRENVLVCCISFAGNGVCKCVEFWKYE